MGVYGGDEGAVRSVVATLQANLAAATAAVWATAGGTLTDGARTLTVPQVTPTSAQILSFEHAFPLEPQWVCVYPTGGDYEPGQEQAWNLLRHGLTVEWAVSGGDSDVVLQAQVARLAQAIWWTLEKNKGLDGNFPGLYNVRPGKWQYTFIGKHPATGALCQKCRLLVTVEAAESAPF